ncbi:hypothetical protein PGTUg99_025404 [Puccinia graminis f. sp. tritici]|uniref:Uncharacterized protein n=1 Tax=Puccinia graminis f. sp. tritici TaxID=56615 RepID=A0A5B0RTZ3_PUCGR|nr:hypothetical protein PGTUg99_028318 [Puccinia graminis f. sp. tritici]KAA1128839.1 hypothetical protein PGTUg99_025404 [Puccinia graminis f. sp. tritici]
MDEEAGVQAGATGEPTPSGETVQDPASKSKAVGTQAKSPKKKKNKSNRLQSTSKAPALSDSGEDDSEYISPRKKTSAKKKRKRRSSGLNAGLTPKELALDDHTDEQRWASYANRSVSVA